MRWRGIGLQRVCVQAGELTRQRIGELGLISKMRILYFAPKECWPATTGALVRNYHLARALSRTGHVIYLSFSDARNRSELQDVPVGLQPHLDQPSSNNNDRKEANNEDPLAWCKRFISVPQANSYTPVKLARGALGRTPVTVLNYTSKRMAHELECVLRSQNFDVVQIESVHLAAYLPLIRAARNAPVVICDWHNIESDLMRQYSRRVSNPLRRAYAQRTARQMAKLERRMAETVDCNVMVSEADLERLRVFAPDAPAFVIENGVDVAHFSDAQIEAAYARWRQQQESEKTATGEPRRNRILFVGSMDYHANVEGIVNFARSVWPKVFKLLPQTKLTVAGRNPTPEVRKLTELPAVEVTGTVEDMRPYYREALVSIVPLNVGGGSRLKICEAMAAGVPVVSTRLGAEGIDTKHEESIILAETAEEFCEAIQNLARDSGKSQAIAAAGRQLVLAKYDWSIIGQRLAEIHRRLSEPRNRTPKQTQAAAHLKRSS
jgi:polysaccharide biosynthesis protein PslH